MPSSSESNARSLAYRVLQWQMLAGLAVALVCLAWGWSTSLSALAGAFTGVVANLYMILWALRPARDAHVALGRMYFGQLLKIALTVILLVLALLVLPRLSVPVSVPALMAAYLAMLAASWWVQFASVRRRAGGNRAGES